MSPSGIPFSCEHPHFWQSQPEVGHPARVAELRSWTAEGCCPYMNVFYEWLAGGTWAGMARVYSCHYCDKITPASAAEGRFFEMPISPPLWGAPSFAFFARAGIPTAGRE